MSSAEQNKKVLFIFTEDWAFSALFLDRAVAAREAGFDVAVHVRCTTHREIIEREGLRVIRHNISRSGTNPVSALNRHQTNCFGFICQFFLSRCENN